MPATRKVSGPDNIQPVRENSFVQSADGSSVDIKDPPVWSRKGLPFEMNHLAGSGLRVHLTPQEYSLDPETFSLPFGVGRSSC